MNQKIKILFLADGNSIHTKRWLNFLTTYFSITLFSLRFVMPENRINVVNYIDTVSKPSLNSNFKKTIQVLKSIVVLRKWISKNKIGFIHAHYSSSYGLLGGFLNHKTLVSSFWGSDIMDFPKKSIIHQLVIKWILMRSTFLMSTSISMKIELNKYTSKSVFLTPFGVDTDLFIPKTNSKDGDGIIIGTIKSLNSVYGIDKLIHAFDLIVKSKQNSQLHIYGKGDEKRNLKTLYFLKNIAQKDLNTLFFDLHLYFFYKLPRAW